MSSKNIFFKKYNNIISENYPYTISENNFFPQ